MPDSGTGTRERRAAQSLSMMIDSELSSFRHEVPALREFRHSARNAQDAESATWYRAIAMKRWHRIEERADMIRQLRRVLSMLGVQP